jgi:hypothetical protein
MLCSLCCRHSGLYHAAQHLWQAASAYQDGNPARTSQQWFAAMRHRLRHGFAKGIIKELDWLSKSQNTSEATKPILRQVRDYLKTHLDHIQYHTFKTGLAHWQWDGRVLASG